MTERSMFWTDGVGDGGPYSQDQLRLLGQVVASSFTGNAGVVPGALNELKVTSTGNNNISMDTGAAIVNGTFYSNDVLRSQTTASPIVGTTGRRVVLEKDWSFRTVRVAVISSADGTATLPALTQTDGSKWQVPLASFTITTGGAISLSSDDREYIGRDPADALRAIFASSNAATGTWKGFWYWSQPTSPTAVGVPSGTLGPWLFSSTGLDLLASGGAMTSTDAIKGMSCFATVATIGHQSFLYVAGAAIDLATDYFDMSVVVCVDNAINRNIFIGFAGNLTAQDLNNRLGFRVIDNGNIVAFADNAGTETTRDAGVGGAASPGTLYVLRMTGGAGTWKFYVNGVQIGADVTTNIPSGVSAAPHFVCGVYNTGATGQKFHARDFVARMKAL